MTETTDLRLLYRLYLEAYTTARTGGVVHRKQIIVQVIDDATVEQVDDPDHARAIAIGASDGAQPRAAPMVCDHFEAVMAGTGPRRPWSPP